MHGDKEKGVPNLQDFRDSTGVDLLDVLLLQNWEQNGDLASQFQRLEHEVLQAIEGETRVQKTIRATVMPKLRTAQGAPKQAGHFSVSPAELVEVERGILYSGAVQGCDGYCDKHDSIALTIHDIGVCLVSYTKNARSWNTRLFRKDLCVSHGDPEDLALSLIERRTRRGGLHRDDDDPLSELAQRGLMAFVERAVLAEAATAPWRMGHGSPAPLELIGASFTDLTIESIKIVRKLIEHERFVFVASEPRQRGILTIGDALRPLEYAVIGTLQEYISTALEGWRPGQKPQVDTHWNGVKTSPENWVRRFRDELAPQVVYGVYKATPIAPAQLFFAHAKHVEVAAKIAIADSRHLENRGFPMLLDMADRTCKHTCGGLRQMADSAYVTANAPYRYQSERATRESLK